MRLFTILDLLRSTLINGMWTIEEQQNEILPLLLNILKNDKNDILSNKEESQFTNH
jgi:FAD synthase